MHPLLTRLCPIAVAIALLAACAPVDEPAAPTDQGHHGSADAGPDTADDAQADPDPDDASGVEDAPTGEEVVEDTSSADVPPALDVLDDGAADAQAEPDATPDAAPDAAPDATPDLAEEPPVWPLDALEPALYLNIGDSVAAGYNAGGRNGEEGRGYARLLASNHADYPDWAASHLRARYPALRVDIQRLARSGATSGDALGELRDALRGDLPASVEGDVIVTINVGGNDLNDNIQNLILGPLTQVVAQTVAANLREMMRLLRERYERAESGHEVLFLVTNVHDPTGGLGTIPASFDEGFCDALNNPRLLLVKEIALANLATYNQIIGDAVRAEGEILVDSHALFLDHGMNAQDRWIDGDCTHFNNRGHHELRRELWRLLTGEAP